MMQRPIINRTEIDPSNIFLRQLKPEDVTDRYVEWLNNPEVNRFLEIRHTLPITKEDVKAFVRDCKNTRRYHWGIFVEGVHAGNISCSCQNRRYNWVDVSNLVGERKYRGTNVCKFALSGAINYLINISKFHRIQAAVYANHFSGITLLTNLGFKKESICRESAISDNRYVDVLRFGLLEDEWQNICRRFPEIEVQRVPWEQL